MTSWLPDLRDISLFMVRDYQKRGYESWLEKNRRWLASAGFHTACFWHATFGSHCFDRFIETAGLQGIFDGDDKNRHRI